MAMTLEEAKTQKAPSQLAAMVVGGAFLLVGVLGFVPGVTTGLGDITFGGHHSGAYLLGVFHVSVLHNVMHLLFGVAGLAAGLSRIGSKGYLVVGGAAYLGLWVYGLVVDPMSQANFVPLNTADNWLHLGLGAGMVGLGLLMPSRTSYGLSVARHGPSAGGDVQ
jgi:hypothetical protein